MNYRNVIAILGAAMLSLSAGAATAAPTDAPTVKKVKVVRTDDGTKTGVVVKRTDGKTLKAGKIEKKDGGAKTRAVVRGKTETTPTVRAVGAGKKAPIRRYQTTPVTRTQDIKGQDAPVRVEAGQPDHARGGSVVVKTPDVKVEAKGDDKKAPAAADVKIKDGPAVKAVDVKQR